MNRKELIESIEGLPNVDFSEQYLGGAVMVNRDSVLSLIEQFDQVKKVVIPKFVADWIERCKVNQFNLQYAMDSDNVPEIVFVFLLKEPERFARAWLDGYEVEKEKVYRIPLKELVTTDGEQQYLTGKAGKYFASRLNHNLKQTFTQTELDNNVPAYLRHLAREVTDEQD